MNQILLTSTSIKGLVFPNLTCMGKNSFSSPAWASNSNEPVAFDSSTKPIVHSKLSPETSYVASKLDTAGSLVAYGIMTVTSFKESPPVSSYSTVILYVSSEPLFTHTVNVIGMALRSSGFGVALHRRTPTELCTG